MPENILVCVAWPYANADIHVGNIVGSHLPADIFARYQRLRGNRVLMVSPDLTSLVEKLIPAITTRMGTLLSAEGRRSAMASAEKKTNEAAAQTTACSGLSTRVETGHAEITANGGQLYGGFSRAQVVAERIRD